MDDGQFNALVATVRQDLTAQQCLRLEQVVREVVSQKAGEAAKVRSEARAKADRWCPHCAHTHVILFGRDSRKVQRFRCVQDAVGGCGKIFNALTGTALARMRKPELWHDYAQAMVAGRSIARITASLPIAKQTAWRWRHRFLRAAAAQDPGLLSGIVEADETFFLRSFKGHRGWQDGTPPESRPPRYRGSGATSSGMSSEWVPVLTAVDRSGGLVEAVLPGRTTAAIRTALIGRITADSVMCTDGLAAYRHMATVAGCEHRVIRPPGSGRTPWLAAIIGSRPRQPGRLGLGRVNARHTILKTVINRQLNGVSTRYLPHYLAWLRLLRDPNLPPDRFIEVAATRP